MYTQKDWHRHFLIVITLSILVLVSACTPGAVTVEPQEMDSPTLPLIPKVHVKTGLEVFLDQNHEMDQQKYALLANQTCVNQELIHGVELLKEEINLSLLLSPEHGLFGAENAGANVDSETETVSGIKSLSTYHKKPHDIAEMIKNLDVILFDIQDIGVRSYTYIYSMAYLMEAAAEAGKKVVILDRPNPIGGEQIEGNLLDPNFSSFVGLYPIPYRHGMTIGELALLFNTEYNINCDLEVIEMEGWTRDMYFNDTGLIWVPTSPHVPDAETILPMIATGTYGELGTLSEGVGITTPFEVAGGPWISNPNEFAHVLSARVGAGVIFRPTFFKPYYGRNKGQICGGFQIHVTDRNLFKPYLTGLMIMSVHQELYPEIDLFKNESRWSMYAKVMGTDRIQKDLQAGQDPLEMESNWQADLAQFTELRKKYLLYN